MTLQAVTVKLPQRIYQQVQRQAQEKHHSIEEELIAVVSAALPELPEDETAELEQLSLLTDQELWQVAHTTLQPVEINRMETLSAKQKRKGLTKAEQQEVDLLLERRDWVMLLRAKSAVFLQERGYDISTLLQTP